LFRVEIAGEKYVFYIPHPLIAVRTIWFLFWYRTIWFLF